MRAGPTPRPGSVQNRGRSPKATTWIPRGGYEGDLPPWPGTYCVPTHKQQARWVELWSRPEASAWHAWNIDPQIVVHLVLLEERAAAPRAGVQIFSELRHFLGELGLTPDSRARLGLVIDDGEPEQASTTAPRRRLKAVDPDGAA